MLAGQDVAKSIDNAGIARPLCPNCGRTMHWTRTTKGTGGFTDVRTFGCGECGVWLTEATSHRI